MGMRQIETLVFDYGGVIVNIDDASVVKAMETTLYFDDRAENAEAGKRFGFQSVLVKTNHLEEHQEWQDINKKIV